MFGFFDFEIDFATSYIESAIWKIAGEEEEEEQFGGSKRIVNGDDGSR